jgi:hypothetical protein
MKTPGGPGEYQQKLDLISIRRVSEFPKVTRNPSVQICGGCQTMTSTWRLQAGDGATCQTFCHCSLWRIEEQTLEVGRKALLTFP